MPTDHDLKIQLLAEWSPGLAPFERQIINDALLRSPLTMIRIWALVRLMARTSEWLKTGQPGSRYLDQIAAGREETVLLQTRVMVKAGAPREVFDWADKEGRVDLRRIVIHRMILDTAYGNHALDPVSLETIDDVDRKLAAALKGLLDEDAWFPEGFDMAALAVISTSPILRRAGAEAMAWYPAFPEAVDALIHLLKDEDRGARRAAVNSIVPMLDNEKWKALEGVLVESDEIPADALLQILVEAHGRRLPDRIKVLIMLLGRNAEPAVKAMCNSLVSDLDATGLQLSLIKSALEGEDLSPCEVALVATGEWVKNRRHKVKALASLVDADTGLALFFLAGFAADLDPEDWEKVERQIAPETLEHILRICMRRGSNPPLRLLWKCAGLPDGMPSYRAEFARMLGEAMALRRAVELVGRAETSGDPFLQRAAEVAVLNE